MKLLALILQLCCFFGGAALWLWLLNWGGPETSELVPADLIHAAQLGLIRPEEFRKNAVKFGWELWEENPAASGSSEGNKVTRSN